MPKYGKNFRKVLEGNNLQERFSIEDAISKSLGASFAKFDETVDVAVHLGVHFPSDVMAGAVVGISAALLVWNAAFWLRSRRYLRVAPHFKKLRLRLKAQ